MTWWHFWCLWVDSSQNGGGGCDGHDRSGGSGCTRGLASASCSDSRVGGGCGGHGGGGSHFDVNHYISYNAANWFLTDG